MPNWCFNDLLVHGTGAKAFLDANSSEYDDGSKNPLCLNNSVPLAENAAHFAFLQIWGTSCVFDTVVTTSCDQLNNEWVRYSFQSPWSPPTKWVESVGEKFPHLSFEFYYAESGVDFRGKLTMRDGQKVEEAQGKYYRDNVTQEEFETLLLDQPKLKKWRGLPSNVSAFMKTLCFYPEDLFGSLDFPSDREMRQKLIHTGIPGEEHLRNFTQNWLMERARNNLRKAVESSVIALVVLLRLQRQFKERYYKANGVFQAKASERFKINAKKRPFPDSEQANNGTKKKSID